MAEDVRVFEMVGLPGAGKSTIAAHLKAMLQGDWRVVLRNDTREEFQMPVGRLSRIGDALGSLVLMGMIDPASLRALGQAVRPAQDSLGTKLRRVALFASMLRHSEKVSIAKKEGKQFRLVEENLLQAIVALPLPAVRNMESGIIRPLVERMVAGDVHGIVVVDCDLETALSRIRSRKSSRSRFDNWDDETARVNLRVMQHNIAVVESAFRNAGRPVLHLSSLQPPESAATEVSAFLQAES